MEQELVSQLLMRVAELQATVESQKPSLWATLGPPAITGIVGFLAAIVPTAWLERRRVKHQAHTLRRSLIAEVSAICEIIRVRQYLEGLQAGAEGRISYFTVPIPEDYFRVYRANVDKLGTLDQEDAFRFVRFYQILESVIQDVTPGGVLYTGQGGTKGFKQAYVLMQSAVYIAEELISGHR
ncbi:hypothetical protein [Fodinicurvata sediminis]|uniref:hypothetical protein n=1 Tax=Fodinicurvata sediminis TaxID=1121832 RepID=UPI0003B51448|nr:hypothetical protein [Fodinicurvata sediminis]